MGLSNLLMIAGIKLFGNGCVDHFDFVDQPLFDFFNSNEMNIMQEHLNQVVKSDDFTEFIEFASA